MQKEPLKGNIGEWSELYALGYLLINAGAYAADENQNAIPEVFNKVLQVFISEKNGLPETHYKIVRVQLRQHCLRLFDLHFFELIKK